MLRCFLLRLKVFSKGKNFESESNEFPSSLSEHVCFSKPPLVGHEIVDSSQPDGCLVIRTHATCDLPFAWSRILSFILVYTPTCPIVGEIYFDPTFHTAYSNCRVGQPFWPLLGSRLDSTSPHCLSIVGVRLIQQMIKSTLLQLSGNQRMTSIVKW